MHPILKRLKERKVVQWSAAYLAGAWLVLQIVEGVGGPWGIGAIQLRVAQALLFGMGFPVAVVLAWYHGDRGRQTVSGAELAIIACLLGIGGIGLAEVVGTPARPTPADGTVTRMPVRMSPGREPIGAGQFEISDDGSLLVYQGLGFDGYAQLWVKRRDEIEPVPVPGTGGMSTTATPDMSISPDGQNIVFWRSSVHVTPISGGEPRTLPVNARCCTQWSPDGEWIYYTGAESRSIERIPASGGRVEQVTAVSDDEATHGWVDVLPGGDAVLFDACDGRANCRIKAQEIGQGPAVELRPGSNPRYSQGYLLFTDSSGTTLSAAPFDARRLLVTGPARILVERLRPPEQGWAQYDVSKEGHLIYAPARRWQLAWLHEDGSWRPADPDWEFDPGGDSWSWELSPDGRRLAIALGLPGGRDIWVKELDGGPALQITRGGRSELPVAWLDNETVLFRDPRDLWSVAADGSREPQLVLDYELTIGPGSVDHSGDNLVFRTTGGRLLRSVDLGAGEAVRELWPASDVTSRMLEISPDGRWIAHQYTGADFTESIELRPFPDFTRMRLSASVDGGSSPSWSADSRTLYYIDAQRNLVAADIGPGDRPTIRRRLLFRIDPGFVIHSARTSLRVATDGRFLMLRAEPEWVWVENWTAGLN